MKWIALIGVLLVWTAQAFAEVGSRFNGEQYTDEELAEACNGMAAASTIAYMVRSILPPDATEEDGIELMNRLLKGDRFRNTFGDELQGQIMADPYFDETVEYVVEYAWMHAHQSEYGLTEEEKLQDMMEFQEDMVWNCEQELLTGFYSDLKGARGADRYEGSQEPLGGCYG